MSGKGIDHNDEWNMLVEFVEINEDQLEAEGYQKLPSEAFSRLSPILQHMPGDIATCAMRIDAKEKTQGACKAIFKDGMHLAKSRTNDGTFRGALLDNSSNKVVGQAKFKPIDELSRTPQLALSIFNTLSIVTSQYYLAKIHNTLDGMESKIDSIATFLSDDKKSQLWADEQTLNQVFQNIVAIQENDAEKMATLVEIKQIKNEALKNTQFFNRQIQSVLKSLSEKDCKSKIENKINDIGEYLFQYSYSVMIYSKACLLDLLIAKVEARQYINSVRNDLREKKEQFNMTIRNCEIELEIYLLTAKAINYSEPVIVKVAPYISPWGSVARIAVGCLGMSLKDNARECVETRLRQVIRNGGNDEVLTKTIESIEEYNKLMNNPIEVICTSDSAYFKVLPLKKTMRSQSE